MTAFPVFFLAGPLGEAAGLRNFNEYGFAAGRP